MSDKAKNILDLGRRSADTEPDELADQDGYQALIIARGKKPPRFHVIDRKGVIYGFGYAYLLGWHYSPPDTLTIYTTTHSITLAGDDMATIEKAFLREMVLQLREHNPATDPEPGAGKPVIKRLNVQDGFARSGE